MTSFIIKEYNFHYPEFILFQDPQYYTDRWKRTGRFYGMDHEGAYQSTKPNMDICKIYLSTGEMLM
jgi:hypothetical protein